MYEQTTHISGWILTVCSLSVSFHAMQTTTAPSMIVQSEWYVEYESVADARSYARKASPPLDRVTNMSPRSAKRDSLLGPPSLENECTQEAHVLSLRTSPKIPDYHSFCGAPVVNSRDPTSTPLALFGQRVALRSTSSRGVSVAESHDACHQDTPGRLSRPVIPLEAMEPAPSVSSVIPRHESCPELSRSSKLRIDRPCLKHGRSVSTSSLPSDSRSLLDTSIDRSVLSRYGYPTYRHIPRAAFISRPRTASALNFLTPFTLSHIPRSSVANLPRNHLVDTARDPVAITLPSPTQSDHLPLSDGGPVPPNSTNAYCSPPRQIPDGLVPTSTLQAYLTSPSPSFSLVRKILDPVRSQQIHFWFDIRNLRKWTDFNTETISSTPDLLHLLNIPVSIESLPTPVTSEWVPETKNHLHKIVRDFFTIRVNAALQVALGNDRALQMRSLHSHGPLSTRTEPEFIANYTSDVDSMPNHTNPSCYSNPPSAPAISARDGQQGRVVGLLRPYEHWNSGMRSKSVGEKLKYLEGLSALHHFMRIHSCRYGFIITEVELVCVRYGGDEGDPVPNFGYLEITDPIPLTTHSEQREMQQEPREDSKGGEFHMTAALALFFLHFVAKKEPPLGQYCWKLDIGSPAACTRTKHLERDSWIPKPIDKELREAKRNRGWSWPDEPLCSKERGRSARKRRRVVSEEVPALF